MARMSAMQSDGMRLPHVGHYFSIDSIRVFRKVPTPWRAPGVIDTSNLMPGWIYHPSHKLANWLKVPKRYIPFLLELRAYRKNSSGWLESCTDRDVTIRADQFSVTFSDTPYSQTPTGASPATRRPSLEGGRLVELRPSPDGRWQGGFSADGRRAGEAAGIRLEPRR